MPAVDPYATKVLIPSQHAKIVRNLDAIAEDAGVTRDRLWTSMLSGPTTPAERDYIRRFSFHSGEGRNGLCFIADDPKRDVHEVMSLMVAALLRNYIRARVMCSDDAVDYLIEHGTPQHTALMIPDLCLDVPVAAKTSAHRVTKMTKLLLNRAGSGHQTVLYVPSFEALRKEYGRVLARHVESTYYLVDLNASGL